MAEGTKKSYFNGTDKGDTLFGSVGNDVINGKAGNDVLIAGGGDDTLSGGIGNDLLRAGDGDDILEGGGGDDTLRPGDGDDGMVGNAGIDTFEYSSGADRIIDFSAGESIVLANHLRPDTYAELEKLMKPANGGGDTLIDFGDGNTLTLKGVKASELTASVFGYAGGTGGGSQEAENEGDLGEAVYGTPEDDELSGGPADDGILGGFGDDTLKGMGGDDMLLGFEDDDVLLGGAGADTLVGEEGDDTLTGGEGADEFVYDSGHDVITDLDGGDLVDVADNYQMTKFWQVVERMKTVGEDTVVLFDDENSIRFEKVAPEEIDGSVFGFSSGAARWKDGVPKDVPEMDAEPGSGTEPGTGGGEASGPDMSLFQMIRGSEGPEVLRGGVGQEVILGGAGNDTIHGSEGDDILDGGAGPRDRVEYTGNMGSFALSIGSNEVRLSGPGAGTDTLIGIEEIGFSSGTRLFREAELDLGLVTGVATLSAENLITFTQMYIAYFDRAPDALGLHYWGTRLAEGMSIQEIARSFFEQPESMAAFPDAQSTGALVDAAYRNLLERSADAEGRAYWIRELDNGNVDRAEFMLAMIEGAKANPDSVDDVRTISEKADLGLYYAGIKGLSNVSMADTVMSFYERGDADSIAEAKALIDGFAAEATDQDGFADEFAMPLVGVIDDPFAV